MNSLIVVINLLNSFIFGCGETNKAYNGEEKGSAETNNFTENLRFSVSFLRQRSIVVVVVVVVVGDSQHCCWDSWSRRLL